MKRVRRLIRETGETCVIRALNPDFPLAVVARVHKASVTMASFPPDGALLKLFYLVMQNIGKKWTLLINGWETALNRFTIQFRDRGAAGLHDLRARYHAPPLTSKAD